MEKGEHKYDDRTKQLMDLRAEAERQFDKQIIYLSAGALVFSVGFVKDIIGELKEPQFKCFLITSWVCFAVSLIVNLFSYISSRKAIDYDLTKNKGKANLFNKITNILNWSSIFGLMIGLIFLIVFAIINF